MRTKFNRTAAKTQIARKLRRDGTNVEKILWQKLRQAQVAGVSFRRQHPAGQYILDFYAPKIRLAIELDGGQHSEIAAAKCDVQRDQWLKAQSIVVLRFWNSDVINNLPGVLEAILVTVTRLKASLLTPTRRWRADLPLSGGG